MMQFKKIINKRRAVMGATVSIGAALLCSAPSVALANSPGPSTAVFTPASGGHWVPYSATAGTATSSARPDSLPGSGGSSCPSGATTSGVYACLSTYKDNAGTGHTVFMRQGKSGTDSTGFGYVHAVVDHNLDEPGIAYTIYNSSAGIKQPNGRYLYGETYYDDDEPQESIEIYEQRTAGGGDKYELGVVTAFCRSSTGSEQSKCPAWVNDYFE